MKQRDFRAWLLVIAAAIIVLDRWSKLWVTQHIPHGGRIVLIPRVFYLSHVFNTGAAFSLFAESLSPLIVRNALIAFSCIAVLVVAGMIWRLGRTPSLTGVSLALILGGALGNLYDRIHLSYVVDFLAVNIWHYHWPDFNVADSAIVVGACLLLLEIFRSPPTHNTQP